MRNAIDNTDDVIDSRDVIERIETLESLKADHDDDPEGGHFSDEDALELRNLRALANEAIQYSDDWEYGSSLIRDSYFTDYAREMLEDCGDIPKDLPHYIAVDWDQTALNIRVDYTPIDFGGVTYWVR